MKNTKPVSKEIEDLRKDPPWILLLIHAFIGIAVAIPLWFLYDYLLRPQPFLVNLGLWLALILVAICASMCFRPIIERAYLHRRQNRQI